MLACVCVCAVSALPGGPTKYLLIATHTCYTHTVHARTHTRTNMHSLAHLNGQKLQGSSLG